MDETRNNGNANYDIIDYRIEEPTLTQDSPYVQSKEKKSRKNSKAGKAAAIFIAVILFIPGLLFKLFLFLTDKMRLKMTVKICLFYFILTVISGVITYFIVTSVDFFATVEGNMKIIAALAVMLAVAVLMMFSFGRAGAKMSTLPIRKIIAESKQISKKSMDNRLQTTKSNDELSELASVINSLLDNIQGTVEAQERFVGDASHEMRTPISIIKGYASMIKRWGFKDTALIQEGVDTIEKEADNMKGLVDNLLFLSKTNRDVKYKYQNFFLNDLVDEIYKESLVVDTSHIITVDRIEVVNINANREAVLQLIRIIFDNAQKYTPEAGQIKLQCFSEMDKAKIIIEDKGIGISPNDLPHIFERFFRSDRARTREGGNGLGMSIAKKIADMHSGDIKIESELGLGTKVTITLPLNAELERAVN